MKIFKMKSLVKISLIFAFSVFIFMVFVFVSLTFFDGPSEYQPDDELKFDTVTEIQRK